MNSPTLILASQSPRRIELLRAAGVQPMVVPADIDESELSGEKHEAMVRRLAGAKAKAIFQQYPEAAILAADTIVVAPNGEVLGKPLDDSDAVRMLSLLQGKTHLVLTAFSLISKKQTVEDLVETKVKIAPMSPAMIAAYVRTGEGRDKAGSYAAQGIGACFIERIEGSYSNVVGLPMTEVLTVLADNGLWSGELLGGRQ